MLLPSTFSSPTPSISPAVKGNKIYSIFLHKILKIHLFSQDPQTTCCLEWPCPPTAHSIMFLFSSFFPHLLHHNSPFNVFVFLIFSHLLHQAASCSHTWGKTPCPRSVFLVWKAGFQFFFIFALWYYRQKWVFWFWHSFRRPSMQSLQNAKVITDSIYTKNFSKIHDWYHLHIFFQFPWQAGSMNITQIPHHLNELQPTRAVFSRNFPCKKLLFGRLSFFLFILVLKMRRNSKKTP